MQHRAASGALLFLLTVAAPGTAQVPAVEASLTAEANVSAGTPVRLMVMKEVTTRSAKVGDRFRLRVDQAVEIGGATVVPVGATAWGEVTAVGGSSIAGKSGTLAARLLYIDGPGGPIALSGTRDQKGGGNAAGVIIGMLTWGPLGLLNHGDNGKLKAGEIFIGYIAAAAGEP